MLRYFVMKPHSTMSIATQMKSGSTARDAAANQVELPQDDRRDRGDVHRVTAPARAARARPR